MTKNKKIQTAVAYFSRKRIARGPKTETTIIKAFNTALMNTMLFSSSDNYSYFTERMNHQTMLNTNIKPSSPRKSLIIGF